MTGIVVVIAAFLLALLLFGFAWGAPIYALPLAAVFLVGFGIVHLARRNRGSRVADLRGQAEKASPDQGVDFTDRDRETLYDRH